MQWTCPLYAASSKTVSFQQQPRSHKKTCNASSCCPRETATVQLTLPLASRYVSRSQGQPRYTENRIASTFFLPCGMATSHVQSPPSNLQSVVPHALEVAVFCTAKSCGQKFSEKYANVVIHKLSVNLSLSSKWVSPRNN